MKKKFVKVMLYGTLALASTAFVGCSDENTTYDEEVKNLQEQIDAINKNGEVTTAELSKAINSAVAALKAELTTAIAGKVDNAVAAEISQKVVDLQNAMTAKADAAAIEATIENLKTQLAAELAGKADNAKIAEVTQKITDLQVAFASKADAATVEALKAELNAAIGTKADEAKVAEMLVKITEMQATLAAKADAANVEAMKAELVAAIGEKADNAKVAELLVKATELQAAIATKAEASAVEALVKDVASLTTEVNGVKTNVQAVKEALTAEINSVKVEIGKAASAETVADLKAKLATLEAQFAAAEAASSKSIAELQKDVEELTAELNNAATAESMRELASKLAEAENTLKAAKELAEGNATKIVAIQNQLAELVSIKSRLDALEAADAEFANINASIKELKEADKAFAKQSYVDEALNAYMKQTEIVSLLDMRLAAYVTAEQADATLEEAVAGVKAYVDNTVKADLLAKISALDTKLTADIAAVSTKFDNYVSKQDADFQAAVKRLETLEAYKASAMEAVVALVNDDEKGNEALSAKIAAISEAMGGIDDLGGALANYVSAEQLASYKFVKEADLGAKIEEYLASYKEEIAGKFAAVEESMKAVGAEIEGIKAMIQSIVFVPQSKDEVLNGLVSFNSLAVKNAANTGDSVVAESKNNKLVFRVAPASAAKAFVENYDLNFMGQRLTRAGGSILEIDVEGIKADEATGEVTIPVKPTGISDENLDDCYVVCLNVTAKNVEGAADKNTDITSDYFAVTKTRTLITSLSFTAGADLRKIYFNGTEEQKSTDYSKDITYIINGDADIATPFLNADGIIPELPISYKLAETNADKDRLAISENGVVTFKEGVDINASHVTGDENSVIVSTPLANFAPVTLDSKVMILNSPTDGKVPVTFNISKGWRGIAQSFDLTPVEMARIYAETNIAKGIFEDMEFEPFTAKDSTDLALTDLAVTWNESLGTITYNVPAGAYTSKGAVKIVEKDDKDNIVKEVLVVINYNSNYEGYYTKLPYNDLFWANPVANAQGGVDGEVRFIPVLNDYDQPSYIKLKMDLKDLFTDDYEVKGGDVVDKEGALNVIVEGDAAAYDKSGSIVTLTPNYNKDAALVFKSVINYGTDTVNVNKAKVRVDNMSGSWTNGDANIEVSKTNPAKLYNGFKWKDNRGKVMWEDGKTTVDGDDFIGNALDIYYLSAPTYTLTDSEGLIKIVGNEVSLTEKGMAYAFVKDYTAKVTINVSSRWGEIGGEKPATITITIKAE